MLFETFWVVFLVIWMSDQAWPISNSHPKKCFSCSSPYLQRFVECVLDEGTQQSGKSGKVNEPWTEEAGVCNVHFQGRPMLLRWERWAYPDFFLNQCIWQKWNCTEWCFHKAQWKGMKMRCPTPRVSDLAFRTKVTVSTSCLAGNKWSPC